MYNKVLVAIDSSASSQHVFDAAVSLTKANNANLMLLHVLSEEEVGNPTPILPSLEYYPLLNDKNWELYQEQRKACAKQGLELLRSCQEQAMASGVNAEFTQLGGSPGRAICELARNWDADLIITGRRGRSGLSELFLGSVSNYVLHHASCSVLIVQHSVARSTAQINQEAEATSIPSVS